MKKRMRRWAVRVSAWIAMPTVALALAIGGWVGWLQWSGNIHELEGGEVIRTAQLSADDLASLVAGHQVRTVINLRGDNPGTEWYDKESRILSKENVKYISIALSASHEPDDTKLNKLIDALQNAQKPILIHCMSGSDRTGLASALYEFLVKHRSAEESGKQLSFWFGHFPWLYSRSIAMDNTYWRVVSASNEATAAR